MCADKDGKGVNGSSGGGGSGGGGEGGAVTPDALQAELEGRPLVAEAAALEGPLQQKQGGKQSVKC